VDDPGIATVVLEVAVVVVDADQQAFGRGVQLLQQGAQVVDALGAGVDDQLVLEGADVPSLPMNACAAGSSSALLRCCSGTTSVAAWAVRLAASSREVKRGRSGMSMISAGGINMMANLSAFAGSGSRRHVADGRIILVYLVSYKL
jgi:hypothetical protein